MLVACDRAFVYHFNVRTAWPNCKEICIGVTLSKAAQMPYFHSSQPVGHLNAVSVVTGRVER